MGQIFNTTKRGVTTVATLIGALPASAIVLDKWVKKTFPDASQALDDSSLFGSVKGESPLLTMTGNAILRSVNSVSLTPEEDKACVDKARVDSANGLGKRYELKDRYRTEALEAKALKSQINS